MSERTARKLDRELQAKIKRLQRGEAEKPKTLEERAKELDRAYLDRVADSVRLNTRGKHLKRLADSKVFCPLCQKRLEKMVDLSRPLVPVEVLICHGCKLGIRADDKYVNNWNRPGAKPIPCPRCDSPMRFFCTSKPYWRAECYGKFNGRRCGAILSEAGPDHNRRVDLGTIEPQGHA